MNPYDLLRLAPEVTLLTARLPEGEKGRWYPEEQAIVLDDRLTQAERRCTLMHELVHRLRGDDVIDLPWFAGRQEQTCEEVAARMLIPLELLARALLWGKTAADLAEELSVDVPMLKVRVATLTEQEKAHISGRLERDQDWGAA